MYISVTVNILTLDTYVVGLNVWLIFVELLHWIFTLQEADRRVKMQNMVRFPLLGMDMAPHMVKRSQSSWSLPSHWSPWRRPYGHNPNDYLYDLYAVCNHHGNMHGGHYTGMLLWSERLEQTSLFTLISMISYVQLSLGGAPNKY